MKKLHRKLFTLLLVFVLLPMTVLHGEIANLPAVIIDVETQESAATEASSTTLESTQTEAPATPQGTTTVQTTSKTEETPSGTETVASTEALTTTETPETSATTEPQETQETVFQDLYRAFDNMLTKQGYVIAQDLSHQRESISLIWNVSTQNGWQSEEVRLTDYVVSPEDAETPLAERQILVKHTASHANDPKELWEFESLLTKPLNIEPVELDTWFTPGMEEQIRRHPIEGTSSALIYTYNMGTLHSEDGPFEFHTLETELSPLDYKESTLFEALPKLADYLYKSRLRLEAEQTTIQVKALITEETPIAQDVVRHSVQWSKSPDSAIAQVRHSIEFNPNTSSEDTAAVLQHLQDNLPMETQSLPELWAKVVEESGTAEVFGDGWIARASAFGQQHTFTLDFSIEIP